VIKIIQKTNQKQQLFYFQVLFLEFEVNLTKVYLKVSLLVVKDFERKTIFLIVQRKNFAVDDKKV